MRWFKGWRVWLGICVVVTAPLFLRDLYHIGTNPPVLNARLTSPLPQSADASGEALLSGAITARLVEVWGETPGGYAGWSPQNTRLPETAPHNGTPFEDGDDYTGHLPEGRHAYRFTAQMENIPGNTLRMVIADNISVATEGARVSGWHWNQSDQVRVRGWLPLPSDATTADIYAGIAVSEDRHILAQFPVPGKFGIAHGGKAKWLASPDGWSHPITVELPANHRPRTANRYHVEIYGLNELGDAHLYATRIASVTPTTERIRIALNGPFRESRPTCAVRVTITPFRWARFGGVPLSVSDPLQAKLIPHTIPPYASEVRRSITGSVGKEFYEVVYAKRAELSHPQVARFVPDSAVIAHTSHLSENPDTYPAPGESFLHVYLPKEWGENAGQMRLTVTTNTGRQIQAVRTDHEYVSGGQCIYSRWKVAGCPPGNLDSVQFGLTH